MSGHSKWSKIKHQKGAKDAKRGMAFTKLAKNITLAANEGGGDPDMNFSLRLAIDKAKEANMPKDNIERAIKKGTGDIVSDQIQRVSYEVYGPSGTALIVDCSTDNTNRTISEIKNIIEDSGGKIADPGSVMWQFEEKGLIVLTAQRIEKNDKYGGDDFLVDIDIDELSLEIMELDGVEDISVHDGALEILVIRELFKQVLDRINEMNLKVTSSELVKLAKDKIDIDDDATKKLDNLVERLEDHEDVDSVWINTL